MDRASVYTRVGVYVLLYCLAILILAKLLVWLGGYFLGMMLGQFISAVLTNWVALKIYGGRRFADLGLAWDSAAARNLALGIVGGIGSASLVLGPPLLIGAAHLTPAIGPLGG
jgi:hypothetical protein